MTLSGFKQQGPDFQIKLIRTKLSYFKAYTRRLLDDKSMAQYIFSVFLHKANCSRKSIVSHLMNAMTLCFYEEMRKKYMINHYMLLT